MSDDLARRAVACKGWRWMPGMLVVRHAMPTVWSRLIYRDDEKRWWGTDGPTVTDKMRALEHWLPDLDDPATLGCLLALVREAWATPTRCLWYDSEMTSQGSWCWDDGKGGFWMGDTEAEALVAALEAAP